jgi:hypothetical protein
MQDESKAEFCGDAWVEHAHRILNDLVAEYRAEIAGERFSACEVFLDPPHHLRFDGEPRVYWSFEIDDGRLTLSPRRELRPSADLYHQAPYDEALPRVRTVHRTDPEAMEERRRLRRETPGGSGPLETLSEAMRALLLQLHNRLATVTA